jgi:hypothetical protein
MALEGLPYLLIIISRECPSYMTVTMTREASMAAYYNGFIGASLHAY